MSAHVTPCIRHRACPLCGLRTNLYTGARLLGDVNAIERGPVAIVKRFGRRVLGRAFGSLINRLMFRNRFFREAHEWCF